MSTTSWNAINEFQTDEIDRRFWLITRRVTIAFLVVSLIVPMLPVFEVSREKKIEVPERVAKVLIEKRQQQKPKPPVQQPKQETKKQVEKKKDVPKTAKPKPEPKPKAKPSVRERVSKVGLLAMRNELAALHETPELKRITNPNRKLSSAGSQRAVKEFRPITKDVKKGSGGVSTKNLTRETTSSRLAERQLTKVDSNLANLAEQNQKGDRVAARTIEEIQLVLERHKGSFNILYTKQLRKKPGLRGKVLFEIVIAPSGRVISCKVVESELKDPSLERKFVLKLKSIDFGEEDVENTIINYPLDFFPS